MKGLRRGSPSFALIAFWLLAGCGTALTPAPAPPTAVAGGERRLAGSLLLYASSSDRPNVYVMTYPKVVLIHILSGFAAPGPAGLCTDNGGNVYVTDPGTSGKSGKVYVYKHGATTHSRTLDAPAGTEGCSVDSSGTLAAVSSNGALAVYQKGAGSPRIYTDQAMPSFEYCAFDDRGRLFVDGPGGSGMVLAEFAHGAFTEIALSGKVEPVSLQWTDGVLVATSAASPGYDQYSYWLTITGAQARIVRTITVRRHSATPPAQNVQAWIQNDALLVPGPEIGRIDVWKYPQGGEQWHSIHENGGYFYGLVVSAE